MFERVETSIPGVIVIKSDIFRDARGFFTETYHATRFADIGIHDHFVQDNHSRSYRATLRGLHYQLRHPQAKLCRVIRGKVFDVAVDIRRGSPTYGRWVGVTLSADTMHQTYIPAGFAHGFVVRSAVAEFVYKCSDFYDPASEQGIHWADPDLAIDWGITHPIVSAKDSCYPRLAQQSADLLPVYQHS
jgi:dTDP-4-dehydrorhamnose 3,5-epimerase